VNPSLASIPRPESKAEHFPPENGLKEMEALIQNLLMSEASGNQKSL